MCKQSHKKSPVTRYHGKMKFDRNNAIVVNYHLIAFYMVIGIKVEKFIDTYDGDGDGD